jgi:hypothetical protein
VAQIIGGLVRGIKINQNIILDGSSSYDKDQDVRLGPSSGLFFLWTCSKILPVMSPSCSFDLCKNEILTSKELCLFANLTSVSSTSSVELTVYDSSHRTNISQVTVETLSEGAPTLQMISSHSSIVKASSGIILSALLQFTTPGIMQWSVDSVVVNLTKSSLTPVTGSYRSNGSPDAIVINLVLMPNSLPHSSSLTFTLLCVNSYGGLSSRTSIIINTNTPPFPGLFYVSPNNGTELKTRFVMSAQRWISSELPLSYSFGFIPIAGELLQIVQGRSQIAFGSSLLPAGSVIQNNAITSVCVVYDVMDASSTVSTSVIVSRKSVAELHSTLMLLLASVSASNETMTLNATRQILAVTASAINFVSCLNSPNCTAMNRFPCSMVENTCSSCFS